MLVYSLLQPISGVSARKSARNISQFIAGIYIAEPKLWSKFEFVQTDFKSAHVSGLVKKKNRNGKDGVWVLSKNIEYYHCDQTLKSSYQTLSTGDFVEQSV